MSRLGNFETIEIPEKHSSKEISPVSPIEEADRKKLDSISKNFKESGLSEADSKIDSQHTKNNILFLMPTNLYVLTAIYH